ncbi:hypothetical protein ACFLVM_00200 [Chloroflexota bacterium]
MACEDFLVQLREGKTHIEDSSFLTPTQIRAFRLVLDAERYLPSVPQMTVPQPVEAELLSVNRPDEDALVLVTGNNKFTLEALVAVWSQGFTPAYFLLVDCLGSTVDMAMVYSEFTPERLCHALKTSGLEKKVNHRRMIIPGLTSPFVNDFTTATGWQVEAGPICVVELPLFLGDHWIFLKPSEDPS